MFKQPNFTRNSLEKDIASAVVQANLPPLHQKGRRPLRSTPFLIGGYKPQRLFVDLASADGGLLAVGGVEQTLAQANVLGSDLD